ncbi:MAG: hypothetical protein HKP30_06980 [Myxococcales bacterium]|nr:hypothetical protein [Myxococcales bacterium]
MRILRDAPRSRRRRRPQIGPRISIALHVATMLLCAVAIRANTATSLAWTLLVVNAVGVALVGVAMLAEHRRDSIR